MSELVEEFDVWLGAHWSLDLTVREWWALLGDAGWAAPALPRAAFGRDASQPDAEAIATLITSRDVLGPPGGAGMAIVAPTIAAHGSPAQIERLLRPIVTGRSAWCLLFSEPAAGSDLASLTTSARRDGDEWRLDGRKTWATGAHLADMAIVLARSDETSSRHHGLTCLALDMSQPDAVDVRPMREMTGRALSNDVTLTGARVPDASVIGGAGNGWIVVNSALTAERQTVGRHRAASAAPGSVPGDLDLRVGEVLERVAARRASSASADAPKPPAALVMELATKWQPVSSPALRQALMRLHTYVEVARLTATRADDGHRAGQDLPGAANMSKLWASEIARLSRDVGLELLGMRGALHAYDRDGTRRLEDADGDRVAAQVTAMALAAQAVALVGGVDRLQRDLLGERVLGLPKAPAIEPPPAV